MPQYQGVWTLQNQAQAQSNQQWVTDPNFKNTTLLLQADGVGSGSQNNTFLDGSTNNFFITRNGNTTQGSFTPFSQAPGYWSNYFVGATNNSLTFASSAGVAFGTGDFSIETFGYANSFPSVWRITAFPSSVVCNIEQYSGAALGVNFGSGTVDVNATLPLSQWFHFLITRQSGVVRVFLNGRLTYTAANTTNYSTSQILYLGGYVGFSQSWDGYLSNFRIQKGAVPTAYQTSSTTVGAQIFNPPTSGLASDANTSILSCQTNRFVDNSASPLAITVTGTPSVQAFGPFAPQYQWTSDVIGGSGYFDGTGDYLVTSGSALDTGAGTSDVTFECWVYNNGYSGSQYGRGIFTFYNSASYATNRIMIRLDNGTNKINCFLIVGGSVQFGGSGTLSTALATQGAWTHIAVVRSSQTFYLYINGVRDTTLPATSASLSGFNQIEIGRNQDGTSPDFFGYIGSFRYLKGTAQYTGSTYTIPTAPLTAITNTQLLLNYTNAGIYDGTMKNNLETVGNAQVSTSVVKNGSGSMYFDGTGDYLSALNGQNFVFGTGDFTIEFWLYTSSSGSGLLQLTGGSTGYWMLNIVSNTMYWQNSRGVNNLISTSASSITNGAWHHIAVARSSGTTKIYFDGVSQASASDTTNYNGSAGLLQIGNDAGNVSLNGFIDDLRVTKGFARYIANFTPPQQALPRQ